MQTPRESRVNKVMEDTGMDYLQAYRTVQSHDHVRAALRHNPRAFDTRFVTCSSEEDLAMERA